MKLSEIIFALRAGNTYFKSLVGGAAEFSNVQVNTLKKDVAFVIPLGEDTIENELDNSISQTIKERFGVICAVKNDTDSDDKAGIIAYDKLHDIRADLLKVLVNLDLGYERTIEYSAGRVLDINRAWLWYQYEFMYTSRIVAGTDGLAEIEYRDMDERQQVSQLPNLSEIYADYIFNGLNSKNLPYTGQLPVSDYIDVDASQQIDYDDDPNPGGYETDGFAAGFKILLDGVLRR